MSTLGSEVKSLRETKGMTLAELAWRTHLGLNYVWGVENDRDVVFHSWQIERLARALGVSEGSILRLIPPEQRRIERPGTAA